MEFTGKIVMSVDKIPAKFQEDRSKYPGTIHNSIRDVSS